jgi:hypothetical protein
MQQNVQNRFNLSQQALADMWQRARDVFDWANRTAESDKDRAFQLAFYALKRDDLLKEADEDQKNAFYASLGDLAANIISDIDWGDLF